jgi:DNA-directed RNA polymerase alpha subunit
MQKTSDYVSSGQPKEQDRSQFVTFKQVVETASLSVRATNVLLNTVASIQEFLALDEERIANFWGCGKKTVEEIVDFQKSLRRKFDDAPPSPTQPEEQIVEQPLTLKDIIRSAGLSIRVIHVLESNIADIQQLLEITEREIAGFKNCGSKTVREIVEFQEELRDEFDYIPTETKREHKPDSISLLKNIKNGNQLLKSIKEVLSKRARNVLADHYIVSLEEFMALTKKTLMQMRNCSKKTAEELIRYQNKIHSLLQRIEEHKQSQGFPSDLILDSSLINTTWKVIDKIAGVRNDGVKRSE